MDTLSDILSDIASYINQDSTLPTGTDLAMWSNLVNQSQNEWSDSFIFRRQLSKTYNVPVSNSMVSFAVPENFERLLSPVFDKSISSNNEYVEVLPIDRHYKNSTEKYVWRVGDETTGVALNINPALTSGASIQFEYLSRPSYMATLNSTITCPSRQFLVLRTISKILSARSDPRFPQVKADSDTILSHLEDDEAAYTGGQDNQTPRRLQRIGFRIGES